jgi:hypothetical protein
MSPPASHSIAMYFQTAATHETDSRVVIAGLKPRTLVLARLLAGFALAAMYFDTTVSSPYSDFAYSVVAGFAVYAAVIAIAVNFEVFGHVGPIEKPLSLSIAWWWTSMIGGNSLLVFCAPMTSAPADNRKVHTTRKTDLLIARCMVCSRFLVMKYTRTFNEDLRT